MRYDTEHKQKSRERILETAAKAIRDQGPEGVGVAAVMKDAGLTHGAFYAHFKSKEALLAASIGQIFSEAQAGFTREMESRPAPEGLSAYIDDYLSVSHLNARSTGCPMAALAGDMPRMSPLCRDAFAAGVQNFLASLTTILVRAGHSPSEAEPLARSINAELIGALALARSEPNTGRSAEMLAASRQLLKQRLNLLQ
jgi:TetR/AcrR family transcriptional repressor of nem operon